VLTACNIVIIGGEGDLALRKLFPALFSLHCEQLLAPDTKIYSVGRGNFGEQKFLQAVKKGIDNSDYIDAKEHCDFGGYSKRLVYFTGDATSSDDLLRLKSELDERPVVFYLSTPPSIFSAICGAIQAAELNQASTRVVVEKPLGESLESFDEINQQLFRTFDETQLYRIDHYLGKETVQNLLALRFANVFFEPLWNRNYIDHVQITVAETVGVGGRWSYYDSSGALRDMVQNHLLQLLCLVAMEFPAKNNPDDVRDEKLKVIRCLKPIDQSNVNINTTRGQYSAGSVDRGLVPGYLEEEDVKNSQSDTETFVAIKAEIENNRWQGVPFYLRTGKRMSHRYSEIVIEFKPTVFKLFQIAKHSDTSNRLVIRLQPDEGVQLNLMNKVPGLSEHTELRNVGLDLSFAEAFDRHRSPSAYERLLLDVTRGDQTLFMRSDELRAAWRWVDGIIAGWEATGQPIRNYQAGSAGPSDAVALMLRDERNWLEYEG
jgi:glucose-6-phosphate 1-dehydrogenase